MILHARKLHYVAQSIIPVGWLAIVAWLIFTQSKDIESILLVVAIAIVFTAIYIYSFVKQVKTPLIVTDREGILIHNVWLSSEKVTWDLIMSVKKYPVFGYKLETVGRDVWLPLGMLTKVDADKVLREIKDHVNQKT